MPEQSVTHATFTIERDYPAAPDRVFAAWPDPATKARWFAGGTHDGHELGFETTYQEIVPDERIVYTSAPSTGGTVATVSLTTVEFVAAEDGTRLVLTAYLDGHEQPARREQGTGDQLDALGKELAAR
ncbi:SRPBCC domain-containing protein [Nocardia sp. BMG51109]|uniref:SRPBCC domain-containing protein n=1 Tax=Nocardia sp. BMG51109 TaxID=1056816 RepID=UPI000466FDAC|nr:SRPBCC domain-containing protein [Nocardia sp. BMG51109]